MTEPQLFKDYYGPALVADLSARILAVEPSFAAGAFAERLACALPHLELKARVAAIADALRDYLPDHYPEALKVIARILGPPPAEGPGMFKESWYTWPLAAFVERHGLDHPAESLDALHAITQRGTAEFAIRPFLVRHPELTLTTLRRWAGDPSFHVRRLVSEGTRTRLPWAGRLTAFIADPAPVLELLERLRADPSEYVRRSVANNLNDIGKDHPALLVRVAKAWMKDATPERERLVRHALRSAVKRGEPEALAVLGADRPTGIEVRATALPRRAPLGGKVDVRFEVANRSRKSQKLVVDLAVHFLKARGEARPKVFKVRALTLEPGQAEELGRSVSFEQLTTRRHYPGPHRFEVRVNGQGLPLGEVLVTG